MRSAVDVVLSAHAYDMTRTRVSSVAIQVSGREATPVVLGSNLWLFLLNYVNYWNFSYTETFIW